MAELVSPLESNSVQNLFAFSIYCASSAWANNHFYKLVQVLLISKIIEENFVSGLSQMETEFDLKVFSVRIIICLRCIAHMCCGREQVTHCGLLYTLMYPVR